MTIKKVIAGKEYTIRVIPEGEEDPHLTESDREMDRRARAAVASAIERAKVMKKPIARYNKDTNEAYLQYPNEAGEYAE